MAIHYSQYFNLLHQDFVSKGVYNAFLDKDSLLHVDPLLLKGCLIPEFKESYEKFLFYFQQLIPLVRFVKEPNAKDLFFKQIIKKFTLREISNTGLGFSKENSYGKGISGELAKQLANSAYTIIKAGLVEPEIFALMQLIEDHVGADRISDMTLYILQEDFLAYTQRIAKELNIKTEKYNYAHDIVYEVPFYRGKPVHFIPMQLLADLPKANDFDEIDKVCNYNNQLKKKIAEVIGLSWAQYKDYKKRDWKELILGNKACYEAVISYYKGLKGVSYDFTSDVNKEYFDILLHDLLLQHPMVLPTITGNIQTVVYEKTKSICMQFKHLVEDNRLSALFYKDKRKPNETDWQMLLYAVADTYKVAANLDVSITREDNPGVGEIDFHITCGSKANTIIEMKRSSNANLIHGYRTQLASYMKAEKADNGIFLIIMEDDSIEQIRTKIEEVQADMKENGEYIPEVIYVNGKKQYSASNRKYVSPKL